MEFGLEITFSSKLDTEAFSEPFGVEGYMGSLEGCFGSERG